MFCTRGERGGCVARSAEKEKVAAGVDGVDVAFRLRGRCCHGRTCRWAEGQGCSDGDRGCRKCDRGRRKVIVDAGTVSVIVAVGAVLEMVIVVL